MKRASPLAAALSALMVATNAAKWARGFEQTKTSEQVGTARSRSDPTAPVRIASDRTLSVPSEFPSVKAALASLDGAVIDSRVHVTIQVAAGVLDEAETIVVDYPYGDRIAIVGAPTRAVKITGVLAVEGQDRAYRVRLNVDSAHDIVPGLYLVIRETAGPPGHELHRGGWRVSSVDGPTTITIDNTASHGVPPTGATGDGAFYSTVLRFVAASGFRASSLGGLANIVIAGNGSPGTMGVWARDPSSTAIGSVVLGPKLLIAHFGAEGVRANYGGAIHATDVVASSNGNNGFMTRDNGTMSAISSLSSGNGLIDVPGGGNGFLAQNSGSLYADRIEAWGNAGDGLYSRSTGSLLVDNDGPAISGYNSNGVHAAFNGFLQCEACRASSNAGNGFLAEAMGSLIADKSVALGNGSDGFLSQRDGFLQANQTRSEQNAINGFAALTRGYMDAFGSTTGLSLSKDYLSAQGGTINR
jgi:hypothetical protein